MSFHVIRDSITASLSLRILYSRRNYGFSQKAILKILIWQCALLVREKNFTFHLRTMVVARCERFRENSVFAILPFYAKRRFHSVFTVSIPFHDRSLSEVLFHR